MPSASVQRCLDLQLHCKADFNRKLDVSGHSLHGVCSTHVPLVLEDVVVLIYKGKVSFIGSWPLMS